MSVTGDREALLGVQEDKLVSPLLASLRIA